jgi:hypothetical protein
MFGQPLEVYRTAQEDRRTVANTALNIAPALQLAVSIPHPALFSNPNDMAAVSMANMAIGVIPPQSMLIQAEAAAVGIFDVITEHHCATLVLTPASTGIYKTHICSLFDGNTQVCCASFGCKNTCDVKGSGHCCSCCSVKYHNGIMCAMVPLRDVVHADGFLPTMLSLYGQDMYHKYKNDLCNLEICNYCKARIKGETLLDIPQEEGDNESVSNVGGERVNH